MREAKARRDQARADLDALQLATQAQVWTAYADFQSALSQHQFAVALVATTKSGYDSALTGYGSGITNFVDLLAAERDYARALAVEVDTRAAILDSAAALAFAAGTTASRRATDTMSIPRAAKVTMPNKVPLLRILQPAA